MKTKTLSFALMSVFLLVVFTSFVSATITLNKLSGPTSVNNDAGSFVVQFNVTSDEDVDVNLSSVLTSGTGSISFSEGPANVVLTEDVPKTITATVSFGSGQTGSIAGRIEARDSLNDSNRGNFIFSVTLNPVGIGDFCEFDSGISGNPGDLKIQIEDISNKGILVAKDSYISFGDDEEWFLFEEIEVEISVENDGDDDVDNIVLEWGLYDKSLDEWVIDVDDEKDFDLKDGDDETITITFVLDDDLDVDIDDLRDGTNYVLYVRATGEVDNDDNDDTCEWDSENIELIIEDSFVIVYDLNTDDAIPCGSEFHLTGDVWNIGEDDQDDVSVRVEVLDLDIEEIVEIGDIDAFDKEGLDIVLNIPNNAEEKTYVLKLTVLDEDGDIYENDYDDDQAVFTMPLMVQGGCSGSGSSNGVDAVISATLESGGEAGKELVIKATVTNTGSSLATYSLNVAGYASWATLKSIDSKDFVLSSGELKNIMITFNVNKDASGENVFDIELLSGNELVTIQPVSVSIKESPRFGFSLGDNTYLWIIGALNIILVAIIIIVAIRVAKK